jgi:hypothetical protein
MMKKTTARRGSTAKTPRAPREERRREEKNRIGEGSI